MFIVALTLGNELRLVLARALFLLPTTRHKSHGVHIVNCQSVDQHLFGFDGCFVLVCDVHAQELSMLGVPKVHASACLVQDITKEPVVF